MATHTRRIASVFAQVLALALIGAAFFIRTPQVSGLSMEPRIHPGEFVLINTLAYRLAPIRRGDIVAFRHDSPTPETYIKRVVGLAGDRIAVEHGQVSIDGKPLPEAYVRYRDERSAPAVTVPPGALYVLGDNRANSDDSRDWGVLRQGDIVGKALASLWPLQELAVP
ncbi:MAG: signal peptidase I [Candidatus Velthaea sp.]